MPNPFYKWKRFWYPRGKTINPDDGGYLPDPEIEYGRFSNPDVVPVESIGSIPCLVLLGEPGIGKSTATRHAVEEVSKEACLWFPLGDYDSDSGLCNAIFGNETFQTWLNGTHRLYLYLDSLDEGLLSIKILVRILKRELGKCPCDRLLFRITCRTADWSNSLEEKLKQLWGESNVGVYELAPLRRVDVIEAAKDNKLDSDAFLQEIHNREAVPLAIKPITLKFLIETYSQNGQLPPTQKKLYLEGCRLLCKEINPDRCDAGFVGTLTPDKKLIVAARIAAVTVFGNRAGIWLGEDYQSSDKDVTVQELSGGKEKADRDEFAVGRDEIKEALGTGLFSSLGTHRIGWTHQTYAEFLAAWYLVQHQMSLTQMMSLITYPNDPDGKLIPQLHEVAAWLAGMVPNVFREILKADPDVLLRSDVATTDVKDREALVENLLKLYNEEKLPEFDSDNYSRYRKLVHPGIVEQIEPYIRDLNKSFQARYVAIDIAEVCNLQVLQDDLIDVALDSSQPLKIRVNAVSAVCRIGNDEGKARLKPLVIGEAGGTPDEQLQHYALDAVWPNHITAKELFAALTPTQSGFYSYRLGSFVQHLQLDDLPLALEWVEKQNPLHHSFKKLVDSIMLKAWEHLESPGVLEAIANLVWSRLQQDNRIIPVYNESFFRKALSRLEDKKRRRILEAILPRLSNLENDVSLLAHTETSIVHRRDVPWLIERLLASDCEQVQKTLIRLIWSLFNSNDIEHVDAVLIASQRNSILAEAFSGFLRSIELDSPQAQKMKSDYLEIHKEIQKRSQELIEYSHNQKQPLLESSPDIGIIALLDELNSGNLAAWWHICREMTLKPDSTHYEEIFELDLTALPGWNTVDTLTRARLIEAAKKYVLNENPEIDSLYSRTTYESDLLGYKALRLLLKEASDFIPTIPRDVWKKWVPFILAYSPSNNVKDKELDSELVRMAYQNASDEFIATLILLIDQENREYGSISIIGKVEEFWDERLANSLLNKAKDEKLKLECMECLLNQLLEHQIDEAKAFTESLIPLPPPTNREKRHKAIIAAQSLMKYAEDAGWLVVWSAMQQDVEFGREVVEAVSYAEPYFNRKAVNVGQVLPEKQLADLYIWLVHQYPHAEDPKHEGVFSPSPRDKIAEWRDSILYHLQERGTSQACKEIERIINNFPELDWLKSILLEAQNLTRRKTWVPLQPSEIIKLASNPELRPVQSGEELLQVLVESLKSLETELQGETPAAIFLWDRIDKNFYKPKDENTFSDYVKLYLDRELKQRGIIVNREVEIRSNRGAAPGERTDIQVDAVVRGTHGKVYDSVTAIIEVKGCWHEHIDHAMETQLVDRYLKDNRCQHGLYLVGWFNCNQWGNDYRKRDATNKLGTDINAARKQFDDQAAELSKQGVQVKAFVLNAALR
jgi:predicted NACHT family NTPase